MAISIHAPPRGATIRFLRMLQRLNYFNSRPSARGDVYENKRFGNIRFQFTPLREGRRDGRGVGEGKGVGISIHAPPRGATLIGLLSSAW